MYSPLYQCGPLSANLSVMSTSSFILRCSGDRLLVQEIVMYTRNEYLWYCILSAPIISIYLITIIYNSALSRLFLSFLLYSKRYAVVISWSQNVYIIKFMIWHNSVNVSWQAYAVAFIRWIFIMSYCSVIACVFITVLLLWKHTCL